MKTGLDYFPLQVEPGAAMELLEARYGLVGFAVVTKFLQRIYGQEGYFCKYDERTRILLSKQWSITVPRLDGIVRMAGELGIFDEKLLKKRQVLTGPLIQQNFANAVKRRQKNLINADIWLISACKAQETAHNYSQSRVEKSREEQSTPDAQTAEAFLRFWRVYPKKTGKAAAATAFAAGNFSEAELLRIFAGAGWCKKQVDMGEAEVRYLPSPSRWLCERRFEDEPQTEEDVLAKRKYKVPTFCAGGVGNERKTI